MELPARRWLEHGYASLPEFPEPPVGPAARPDLAAQFPLVLTSAKRTLFCQTQHRALPSLRKRAAHPEVELHPTAAEARGIAAGDWVSIETPEGQRARPSAAQRQSRSACRGRRARLVAGLPPLRAPGYDPFGSLGANLNLLIGTAALDPVSGTASLRSYLCEIRRAAPV
jgi:anaerobic selenocysteine-containing dehydrogenase